MRLNNEFAGLRDPWLRTLIIILTVIAALYLGQMVWYLVGQVVDLIVLFVVAWIISFVLEPLVGALTQIRGVSRTLAVVLVYLALLVLLGATGTLLIPVVATQAALVAEQLPALGERLLTWARGWSAFFGGRGIVVSNYTEQLLRPIEAVGPLVVANALTIATGAASVLFQVFIIIVLSLYLMLDGERMGNYLLLGVPPRYRDDFRYFVSSVYRAFGGFLRGQIIMSVVYAIGVAAIGLATGLPFVALASFLAGLAMVIPFLGPALGLVPPLLVALTAGDVGRAVIIFALTLVLNAAVVNVVQPKVMSQQIGLHPIVVLASFLVGARIAGPWGAVFGVPVAAVIVTMVSFYRMTVSERRERLREVTGASEVATRSEPDQGSTDRAAAPEADSPPASPALPQVPPMDGGRRTQAAERPAPAESSP